MMMKMTRNPMKILKRGIPHLSLKKVKQENMKMKRTMMIQYLITRIGRRKKSLSMMVGTIFSMGWVAEKLTNLKKLVPQGLHLEAGDYHHLPLLHL
jgi:hypothetical protein